MITKKRMPLFFRLVICFLFLGVLTGCQGGMSGIWKGQEAGFTKSASVMPHESKMQSPVKIALLVPLTGKYAAIGRQLLDAAQLALFHFNRVNMELIPIDTGQTPHDAEMAADKAVSQSVALILGPLLSDATRAVVPIAQRAGIQVISFSNDQKLAGTGAFVLGFRPEAHIKRVIEYAYQHNRLKMMQLVTPDNAYGNTLAQTVSDIVGRYPGALQLASTHIALNKQDEVTQWTKQIQSNMELFADRKEPLGLLISEGELPIQNVMEALNHTNFQLSHIQLMGTASWYDDRLLTIPSMEGAIFAAFPREQQIYFEQQFFMKAYGYQPHNIASLAYDAVALAATLENNIDNGLFTPVMLTNSRGFLGINGLFRFAHDGLIERGLAVMQIQHGKFVVVDPAPRAFK